MTREHEKRKQGIKTTFDLAAAGYDGPALRFFPKSAEWLVSDMQFTGNEQVLDIATGTGLVALAAARKLNNGTVIGIDFSKNMLAQAKEKAELSAIRNVSFRVMDADLIYFPDRSFDAISCGFGIFFMENISQSIKNYSRFLKKGAKFAASSFEKNSYEPLSSTFLQRIEAYGVEIPPLSYKKIDSADKLTGVFSDAGLDQIQVRTRSLGYYLPTVDGWWDLLWNAGYRGLLGQLSDTDLQQFRLEHLQEIQSMATTKGLWLEVNVLFAVGVKTF